MIACCQLCVTDKGSVVGKEHNSTVFTLVLARRRVNFSSFPSWRVRWRRPPSLQNWEACWRRIEKKIPNRVGAHTQPCFSPLRILNGGNQESSWRNIITKNIHTRKRDALSTLFIFEFRSTLLSECLHR